MFRSSSTTAATTHVVCPDLPSKLWVEADRALESEPNTLVVRCPAMADQVLAICDRLAPAVLIIDTEFFEQLPQVRFVNLCRAGRVSALALAQSLDDAYYDRILRAGCAGALLVPCSAETYRRAIRAVALGEFWAPRRVLSQLVRDSVLRDAPHLTPRESQILGLLALGCSNGDIAKQLFLSRDTVRWHLRGLYSKIGVADRASAIQYARSSTPAIQK